MFQLVETLMDYFQSIENKVQPETYKIQGGYFTVPRLREIYNKHGQPTKKGNYLDVAKIADCCLFSKIQYKGCIYYIFGEIHKFGSKEDDCTHESRCYEAGNIIDKIISCGGGTRMVDIYLEIEFTSAGGSDLMMTKDEEFYFPPGDLFMYSDKIKNCLPRSRTGNLYESECPDIYKNNARFHYTDTRVITVDGSPHNFDPLLDLFLYPESSKIKNYEIFRDELYNLGYNSFLRALFNTRINLKTTPYMIFLLGNEMMPIYPTCWSKIQKNISYLPVDIRNSLYKYVMIEFGLRFQIIHSDVLVKYGESEYIELHKSAYHISTEKKISNCLSMIFSLLIDAMMDIYLISRMFRNFGESHVHSKIKIMYTGAAHSKGYIKFFTSYLNTKPDIFIEKEKKMVLPFLRIVFNYHKIFKFFAKNSSYRNIYLITIKYERPVPY